MTHDAMNAQYAITDDLSYEECLRRVTARMEDEDAPAYHAPFAAEFYDALASLESDTRAALEHGISRDVADAHDNDLFLLLTEMVEGEIITQHERKIILNAMDVWRDNYGVQHVPSYEDCRETD